MDNKLKEWLLSAKNKGYSNEEIKKLLLQRGYSEHAIRDIFGSLENRDFDKNARDFANKKILKVSIGILLIITTAIIIFSFSDINNGKDIEVIGDIKSLAVVETRVNGNIQVRLPEIVNDKISPSDNILNRTFQVKFLANSVFIGNDKVLAPSSVIPEDWDIKLKAINELGLLEQADNDYKNRYATLSTVSRDIFVIWKEQELIVAKGNVLKTEFLGDKGVSLIGIRNLHEEYGRLDREAEKSGRFNVFFKNVTQNYEINNYRISLRLNDKEISGEMPVKIKDKIANGAVAMDNGRVLGMFVKSNEEIYFINAKVLESITKE